MVKKKASKKGVNKSDNNFNNITTLNWIYLIWGIILIILLLSLFIIKINTIPFFLKLIAQLFMLIVSINFIINYKRKNKLILSSLILTIIPIAFYGFVFYATDLDFSLKSNLWGLWAMGIPLFIILYLIALVLIVINFLRNKNNQ
jgi:hypothetical protein|tara:strand:+ start:71 stop:505 length:435 start_codon:yes stop_codon:yes gene_type:complete